MMTFRQSPILSWLAAALALAPAALFAYLGQFSRMMSDDYCQIAEGKAMGAWGYMIHQLDTWSGGYANWFFKGAIAPLDTLIPRMMPALIIALWLVGLSWLVFQCLAHLKIDKPRRPFAVAIAALTVAASINAFYSPQSFYWYAASTHYTLPMALLTVYMALAFWLAKRTRPPAWGLAAGGLLCFISAGASEIFIVFQVTFLALCLLASFVFLRDSVRRSYALVFGIGWLATLIGLAIQLSAPGIARRAEVDAQQLGQPIRSIPTLAAETLRLTFETIGHPPAFAGFVMLMAVGLLVMLLDAKPQPAPKAAQPVRLALPPLWLGLIFQLLYLPLLWGHTSDHPQFLGRFSGGYMMVVVLNATFILGFLFLLWQRGRIQTQLQRRERGLSFFGGALLLTALLLFALTQFRSIHYRAATYLFTSSLIFLVILFWQLSSPADSSARRFSWLAVFAYAAAAVCMAAIIGAALFGRGFVDGRILAPAAFLLTASGLFWGVGLGCSVKNIPPSQAGQSWVRLLKAAILALVLVIGIGIAGGQAARLPVLQRYAREWDARHQRIIAMRGGGQTTIEAAPLTWDLADDIRIPTLANDPANRCAVQYYDVESIVVTDG